MDSRALIEELASLVRDRGAERFLATPLVTPTPTNFPDPFDGSDDALETLAERVFALAGLEHEITIARDDEPYAHATHAMKTVLSRDAVNVLATPFGPVEVSAMGARSCALTAHGVLRDAPAIVASLCRAAAIAFDAGAVGGGYRTTWTPPTSDDERRRVDLLTFHLGFGILTTNDSYRFVQERDATKHVQRHLRAGYLDEHEMSYLLAVQVHARGLGVDEARRIAQHLEPNQRAYFLDALDQDLPPRSAFVAT